MRFSAYSIAKKSLQIAKANFAKMLKKCPVKHEIEPRTKEITN